MGRAPKYLSIQEAAERLGVNHSTVWRWVQKGEIESEQILGRTAIRESVVDRKARARKRDRNVS